MNIDISEIHNKAINEYIDSILSSEGLILPFISKEMELRIKKVAKKKVFLAGYNDALDTVNLNDNTYIGTVTSFGLINNN